MRVLIACEFSGIVRDAFCARGHDAWSVDLLPSEQPGPHFQTNALFCSEDPAYGEWDLMIAHPPCTYLCNSGVRWLYNASTANKERWHKMEQAAWFFKSLWNNERIARICIENPIPHRHAQLPAYSQIIHPWQYGHPETKATCLWLKNLPELESTNVVAGRTPRVHHAPPGPDRWKERSRTLEGIAAAMADQWGAL